MIDNSSHALEDSAVYEYAFGYKFFTRTKRFLIALFAVAVLILAGLTYFRSHYININVMGASMETTLDDGDCVILKLTKNVERGDIVVIDVENLEGGKSFSGKLIIKRVIALGGDEVYCKDGTVYLKKSGESDFTPLEEEYVTSKTPSFSVVSVGENEFFFLGDNRAVSMDSTEIGCLSTEKIYGIVPSWAMAIKEFTSFIY